MSPPDDSTTTLADLRERVRGFVRERDWSQFHTPKNLAMALAIEAAELMEHFQWLTPDASRAVAQDDVKRAEVGEEIADILCYIVAMASELGIDLSQAFFDKMLKNERKYPADEFRGRYDPGQASA
ncbi:MAG: nucleotide pyrophosphohydrolase [Pirellulales bacterium]|nr:nucleotide pyrophosphohydrolase [Pirellulales bacterium]